jgi:hypothetical protein
MPLIYALYLFGKAGIIAKVVILPVSDEVVDNHDNIR